MGQTRLETIPASRQHLSDWVVLRHKLWPQSCLSGLRDEAEQIMEDPDQICFLLIGPDEQVAGFIEGKHYQVPEHSYVHVEGWYVEAPLRRQGHGTALMAALEQWSLHHGIRLLTSDTNPQYVYSPAAHIHAGFRKIHECTIFLKEISPIDSSASGKAEGAPY